jgi:hypothetical protein
MAVWTWIARVVTLLGVLAGILAAAKQLPVEARDYAALAVSLLGAFGAWIYSFLPAKKAKVPPVAVLMVAGALIALAGCKVPPLATAYRSHALLVTARDGAGESLAKVQRAKMIKCEADYMPPHTPETRGKLINCLRAVRAPISAWTTHIRPAITAASSALWLALEVAYVAGDKSLSSTKKAGVIACSALKAAEKTIGQYAEKLGELKTIVLGAIAGGKVLVCK